MYEDDTRAEETAAVGHLLGWASASARAGVHDLPPRVIAKALAVICDDIAAAIAASGEPEVRKVNALAVSRAPGGGSTLLGAPMEHVGREWAAAANAIAANWLELDGGYRLATCHGSLYTLPSALAELEVSGGTVGDVITALVSSYEVVTRVARAYRPPLPLAAHPHATLSPLGSAAALAAARKLDDVAFADTVLSAATFSLNGPFSHAQQGATIRNGWAGAGARLGFLAADLVEAGLSGSTTALHDVFSTSYGYPEVTSALTGGLGDRYAIEDAYHKLYACCQYLHSSVEAAYLLTRSELANVNRDDIVEIHVETHPLARALGTVDPSTVLGGKFSLPHAVSVVLATGSIAPAVFSGELLHDPAVRALRARVRISEWASLPEPPEDRPAKISVTLRDGSTREQTVLSAIGGPDRALTQEQLISKFETVTASRHPHFASVAQRFMKGERADLDMPLSAFLSALLSKG
ncbi:MmgE/PrpD family protein [Glaciibacter superstes]|uniref:MmgE/PrpD family protein n=1 Tax=Glaciibacter superstes TaxID=501023 RepID=UPI0003B5280B|nr:MmgE/PrpD family protein [Glaciibacter superstes]